jgi:ATP-dependent DNA helicase RecG
LSKSEIAVVVGKQTVDGQLHSAVRKMLQAGQIEYVLPDMPNSRLQK